MKQIFASLFLLLCSSSYACLNLYVINEAGRESIYDHYRPYDISINEKYDLESLRRYEQYIKEGKKDLYYTSNYAVYLIKLGRHREALPILRKLYIQHPQEYNVIANLGVAYELNGHLDSAFSLLRNAITINPGAHRGSEWIHVKILKAAISIEKKEAIADTLNILQLEEPRKGDVGVQLGEQWNERVPLTGAPNSLLSKCIEESGDYFRREISIDWAVRLYAIAMGYATTETVKQRLWQKIETARARAVELTKLKPRALLNYKDNTRQQLLKKNWKQFIQKDIDKWSSYKPAYAANIEILNL
jgi:tetratricopeptide (TPR) repeat protein